MFLIRHITGKTSVDGAEAPLTRERNASVDNTVVLTIVSLKYTAPVEYSA